MRSRPLRPTVSAVTLDELHRIERDLIRWEFVHDCRVKLDLIEHGYAVDPEGRRAAGLERLIGDHSGTTPRSAPVRRRRARRRPAGHVAAPLRPLRTRRHPRVGPYLHHRRRRRLRLLHAPVRRATG